MTRLAINMTILAPEGATVPGILAHFGDPASMELAGYEVHSCRVEPHIDHFGRETWESPMLRKLPPPEPAAAAAPTPEPTVSKSRVKRLQAQGAPAEPPAQIAPADQPDAGVEAAAPPPAPPPEPEGPSVEVLRAAVRELIDSGRGARVKAILTDLGASSVSDVLPARRDGALKALQLAAVE